MQFHHSWKLAKVEMDKEAFIKAMLWTRSSKGEGMMMAVGPSQVLNPNNFTTTHKHCLGMVSTGFLSSEPVLGVAPIGRWETIATSRIQEWLTHLYSPATGSEGEKTGGSYSGCILESSRKFYTVLMSGFSSQRLIFIVLRYNLHIRICLILLSYTTGSLD